MSPLDEPRRLLTGRLLLLPPSRAQAGFGHGRLRFHFRKKHQALRAPTRGLSSKFSANVYGQNDLITAHRSVSFGGLMVVLRSDGRGPNNGSGFLTTRISEQPIGTS